MDSASGAKLGGFILSLKQVSRLTQLLGGRQTGTKALVEESQLSVCPSSGQN